MSVEQVATRRLLTVEQFEQLPEVPGMQFELADGELIEMPTPGVIHNYIVMVLSQMLFTFVRERNLGLVCGDNTGYMLRREPGEVRVPDVSFIAWDRIPPGGLPEGSWQTPPNFAVEVVSPSDSAREVHRKVLRYLDTGVQLVWAIWPDERTVTVYPEEGAIHERKAGDELDGGEVLPGFRVRVGDLFAVPTRPGGDAQEGA